MASSSSQNMSPSCPTRSSWKSKRRWSRRCPACRPKSVAARLYNGDELLYVMVRDRMAVGPVAGAVGTLMTNMALEVAFKELGIGFARAKVGDRYVLEVMQERGWLFGGEGSGHLLCLDK